MTKQDILNKLQDLELDKTKIIIISGASLVLQGIIEKTIDIDLTCDDEYYQSIKWNTRIGAFGKEIKYKDIFEISNNLYYPKDTIIIEGYRCLNLERILTIKKELNRSKDLKIIKTIETYIKNNKL